MRLTVLGSAGTYPSAGSGCSSYLVEHDGFRLLLDAGNNAVSGIQRHGDVFDIDAVLISHLHADHCVDLCAYYYVRTYHPRAPGVPLPLWGPRGTRERVLGIFDHRPPDELASCYTFHDIAPGQFRVGPFTVTAARMAHPVECFGLRLQAAGATLAYSADTGPNEALVELARDCDLMLCEASWADSHGQPEGVHMTGAQAGEHAVAAGARRLVLTHLVAWDSEQAIHSAAEAAFGAPVQVAHPDRVFDI